MQDYIAICNLKARYCAAADSAPEDRGSALARLQLALADDVIGDYGLKEPLHGGPQMAAFLCDSIAGSSQWMVHNIHSPLIEIDGDKARGQWTVNVRMKRRDGEMDFVFGRYFDEFVRQGGEWKITRVAFQRYE